jgi:hypothetical protein
VLFLIPKWDPLLILLINNNIEISDTYANRLKGTLNVLAYNPGNQTTWGTATYSKFG